MSALMAHANSNLYRRSKKHHTETIQIPPANYVGRYMNYGVPFVKVTGKIGKDVPKKKIKAVVFERVTTCTKA